MQEYVYSAMLIHKVHGSMDENRVLKVIEAAGGKPEAKGKDKKK